MKTDYLLLYTALGLGVLSFGLDLAKKIFNFIPEKTSFTLLILSFIILGIVVVFWIIKFILDFIKETKESHKK